MKKLAIAAIGLISLSACNRPPEGAATENRGDDMEMKADNMEAMAESSSNAMAADMMENNANDIDARAGNVAERSDAMAANKADKK
ncbi:MAG: hypothetical protein K2Y20_01630 [Sphingomonas sp.]|nr:hypothetical protein [Sphingomonas sp.]